MMVEISKKCKDSINFFMTERWRQVENMHHPFLSQLNHFEYKKKIHRKNQIEEFD